MTITIRANKKEGTITQEVNDLLVRPYKSLTKEEQKKVNDALTEINPKRKFGEDNYKERDEAIADAFEAWSGN